MSIKRDIQKDLVLCSAATPGPWESSPAGNWYGAEPNYFDVSSDYATIADLISNKDDARFIAQAREALPYWLARVQELQKEIDNFLTFGQGGAGFRESQLIAELAKTEAQAAAMRKIIESARDDLLLIDGSSDPESLIDDALEKLENSLSTTAGKEMLEYVKRLEAVAEAVREYYANCTDYGECETMNDKVNCLRNCPKDTLKQALAALDGEQDE